MERRKFADLVMWWEEGSRAGRQRWKGLKPCCRRTTTKILREQNEERKEINIESQLKGEQEKCVDTGSDGNEVGCVLLC